MRNLLFITATALLPLAANAQIGAGAPATPALPPQIANAPLGMAKISPQDAHFIKVAAIAGMSEVNDGNLAAAKGDSTVKQIGTTMVADHTKANDQLVSIAKQKDATVPASVDVRHAAITAELKVLSGASFDRKYLKTELTGHEMTIAAFKLEASSGSDPDLKSFAQTTLPILQQHLAMIEAAMK